MENRISYNFIKEAMERYKANPSSEENKSILERFLEKDPDPTRAIIMALDMLFAGVDTVN
jgi:hypothetical protein